MNIYIISWPLIRKSTNSCKKKDSVTDEYRCTVVNLTTCYQTYHTGGFNLHRLQHRITELNAGFILYTRDGKGDVYRGQSVESCAKHSLWGYCPMATGESASCWSLPCLWTISHAQEDEPTVQQAAWTISLLANSLPISLTASVHVFRLCL